METRQMTSFFHPLFQLYLFATLVFVFESSRSLFLCCFPRSILVCKILEFLDKGYQFGWSVIRFQKDTLAILKIHIMFALPEKPKVTIFTCCLLLINEASRYFIHFKVICPNEHVCSLTDIFLVPKFLSNQFAVLI